MAEIEECECAYEKLLRAETEARKQAQRQNADLTSQLAEAQKKLAICRKAIDRHAEVQVLMGQEWKRDKDRADRAEGQLADAQELLEDKHQWAIKLMFERDEARAERDKIHCSEAALAIENDGLRFSLHELQRQLEEAEVGAAAMWLALLNLISQADVHVQPCGCCVDIPLVLIERAKDAIISASAGKALAERYKAMEQALSSIRQAIFDPELKGALKVRVAISSILRGLEPPTEEETEKAKALQSQIDEVERMRLLEDVAKAAQRLTEKLPDEWDEWIEGPYGSELRAALDRLKEGR